MKRTLIIVFLLLSLVLAACGGTPEQADVEEAVEQAQEAVEEVRPTVEAAVEEVQPTVEAAVEEAVTEAAVEAPTEAPAPTEPPTEEPAEESTIPNVLKVASTANVTTWDPIKSFSTEALYMANLYESLLRVNPPGSAEPYTPDVEVLMTAYPDYWGGWQEGQFEKVLVQIVPEAVQQQQMLEGGEVDLALRIPQENYASFAERDGYTLLEEPSLFNYVGFFNTTRPPLDNPQVRQALSYAIPYQDIIDVSTYGQATQARGPVPAGVWPYSENVMQYTYDLEKARELLAEAGYPDGGFDLRLTYAAENATEERFAPLIKDAFAELGINVTIEPILFNQQWEEAKADPANAQDIFLLLYWPTYSDAGTDNLYSMFHSSEAPFFNLSYWANTDFDTLIDDAAVLTVTDPDTAFAKYEEAQNLLVEEAPGIFFMDTMAAYVIPDHIGGFQYNLNYPFATFFYDLFRQ